LAPFGGEKSGKQNEKKRAKIEPRFLSADWTNRRSTSANWNEACPKGARQAIKSHLLIACVNHLRTISTKTLLPIVQESLKEQQRRFTTLTFGKLSLAWNTKFP